jgi:hypothetical protein
MTRIQEIGQIVFHEDQGGFNDPSRIVDIDAGEPEIQGNNQGPDSDDSEIGFEPFYPVAHEMKDLVSFFDPGRKQGVGYLIDPLVKLVIC